MNIATKKDKELIKRAINKAAEDYRESVEVIETESISPQRAKQMYVSLIHLATLGDIHKSVIVSLALVQAGANFHRVAEVVRALYHFDLYRVAANLDIETPPPPMSPP